MKAITEEHHKGCEDQILCWYKWVQSRLQWTFSHLHQRIRPIFPYLPDCFENKRQ